MFVQNQRRLNIKLASQNHVFKTEEEDCEGLGGTEFKEEKEKSEKSNAKYYEGLKQIKIENIKTF